LSGKPRKRKVHLPPRLRKLTRAEAAARGVSYTAKRRVNADLKKITKRTRLYSDREVAEAKLGTTKQAFTKINKHKTIRKISSGKMVHYSDLSKEEFFLLLEKYHSKLVQPHFYVLAGERYKGKEFSWTSHEKINAGQLRKGFKKYLIRHEVGAVYKYGVTVYA